MSFSSSRFQSCLCNTTALLLGSVGALTLGACSKTAELPRAESQVAPWRAVVEEQLANYSQDGLPEVDQNQVDEYLESMELAEAGGKMSKRFRTRLEQAEALELSSALLTIVEDRTVDAADKTRAYGWLRARGDQAIVPRLTLRLKYEKDWVANVDIALTLLNHGSGAGLQALHNILATEVTADQATLEYARFRTMEALAFLPISNQWQPGNGFDSDWQHLLEVQSGWEKTRQLPGATALEPSRALRAEAWRMMARLRSQPLRPVDDARFVFVRMPNWIFEPLSATVLDNNRYVREHALQTLAWIGYPVGLWAQQNGVDLTARYKTAAGSAAVRPRAMEAMGASGLASMETELLYWLQTGNLEEITAAADALLRCASEDSFAQLSAHLASDAMLSPEARYSLQLLFTQSDAVGDLALPQGLDSSEAKRRQQWRLQRGDRPK
jgi:hypothetical protein